MGSRDQGGYSNKVDTAETAIPGLFVSWIYRPDGKRATYIKPMKEFFYDRTEEDGLVEKWKVSGFAYRRVLNGDDDEMLPGSPGEGNWGFDAIVTVSVGDTATSVGKGIAKAFTDFTGEPSQRKNFNSQQKFIFRRDVTESVPAPLNKYILTKNAVDYIKNMFAINALEDLDKKDIIVLLENFFGSEDTGRRVLEYEIPFGKDD